MTEPSQTFNSAIQLIQAQIERDQKIVDIIDNDIVATRRKLSELESAKTEVNTRLSLQQGREGTTVRGI